MAYIEKEKISIYIRENFSIDKTKNADICFAFIDFMNWLDDAPTADVVEVKHGGKWLRIKGDTPKAHKRKCSKCGGVVYYPRKECLYKSCPYCFVMMDGRRDT